ncbi:hypothetical protein IQ215_05315 [Cyanobacterium stanieri LEGE 03274]|uniref:DNA-binding protein n=1 Tax=Cyanobacterium stanieri LEGE 03274 TaxID=1828756 RepID=A0ABR9V4N5_9CHRO|nr:hypothetical protein [Cyanobacterium stanieri]MBE9222111.1 hypothetical protein [Cyanobacterium stanieri LEGE 03274]
MNRFFGSWRSMLMAIALITTGCGYLIHGGFAGENNISIEDVEFFALEGNNQVKVEGEITQVIPLVNGYAYEIKDNTGSIWVTTTGDKPEVGQNIVTSVTIQEEEIIIDEKDMSSFYLREVVEEDSNISENETEADINPDDTMESEEENPTSETDNEE